nr:DUF4274 domain-containing protein [Bacteroides fragilis]MDA1488550.1 DUF4274 domain-containing protein [Bacteroides fragilis]
MKDEVKQYIDDCIIENPDIDLNNLSVFTQPDELHYLANVVNWDIHIPILDWIVKQAICSEATALMIFGRHNHKTSLFTSGMPPE